MSIKISYMKAIQRGARGRHGPLWRFFPALFSMVLSFCKEKNHFKRMFFFKINIYFLMLLKQLRFLTPFPTKPLHSAPQPLTLPKMLFKINYN